MIEKRTAIEIKKHACNAIQELTGALFAMREGCSENEYEKIKKSIGLAIGRIETDVLGSVYCFHPDLKE